MKTLEEGYPQSKPVVHEVICRPLERGLGVGIGREGQRGGSCQNHHEEYDTVEPVLLHNNRQDTFYVVRQVYAVQPEMRNMTPTTYMIPQLET